MKKTENHGKDNILFPDDTVLCETSRLKISQNDAEIEMEKRYKKGMTISRARTEHTALVEEVLGIKR